MSRRAKDVTLVLHVGLHKTATTWIQNVLSARRQELLGQRMLYPTVGTSSSGHPRTRDGAQSGHILFTRPGKPARSLVGELLDELPRAASTVLLSSEDFTRPGQDATAADHLDLFSAFGTIKVVLVLRRQDVWIESFYKQLVDQYAAFETRSFAEFLDQRGRRLLDFHARFGPWRALVGPENFHALSYDDLPGGAAICRRLLEIAGVHGHLLDEVTEGGAPRYDSVRPIDTVGLRILNSHRLPDRDIRTGVARSIYDVAPAGDIELMSEDSREEIQAMCRPINERIEAEWFTEPVPGFRFGRQRRAPADPPTGPELLDYVEQVISLCADGLRATRRKATAGGGQG